MVICAITLKTNTATSLPFWRNIWYADYAGELTYGNAVSLAGQVLLLEQNLELSEVQTPLVAFVQPIAAEAGSLPAAYVVDGTPDWGNHQRSGLARAPWVYHLRLPGQCSPGTAVNWMLGGCIATTDMVTGQDNGCFLTNRPLIQTLLDGAMAGDPGDWWPHLCSPVGGGLWPIGATKPVAIPVIGGVSKLNAARRASAKVGTNADTIFSAISSDMNGYCQGMRNQTNNWKSLEPFDFFPADVYNNWSILVGYAADVATQWNAWAADCDPATPGSQVPNGRFLMTEASLSYVAGKLTTACAGASSLIEGAEPFLSGGGTYYHQTDYDAAYSAVEGLAPLVAPFLAYDWWNPANGGAAVHRRGGYIALHPESDPAI